MFFNRKLNKVVNQVNSYSDIYKKMSDDELKSKTQEFKSRLTNGETLDDILPEAFALVREAADRVIGLRHYDVQIMGGYILHQGDIAEMKTGEGKTLVATLSAYLNALTGKGVHIVTVNDYLAKRDKEWMGKIYEYLGLSVGLVQNEMSSEDRKIAYGKDITYVTNKELGFDFLRDSMAKSKEQKVLREFNYAIIDEVDSVLIDEARTPLIISTISEPSTDLYIKANEFVKGLKVGEVIESELNKMGQAIYKEYDRETGDVIVNRKEKLVHLTDEGIKKAEEFFGIKNYGDIENNQIVHHVNQALKANFLFRKDIDYIVRDGKVEIVDEFTGRVLKGRVYSDGLHQAIEAKEGVQIQPESKTLASITYQNLFRMYKKIAGMTGTAKTEEMEFREIYGMEVKVIPTNKPVIRIDRDDIVFVTKEEKYDAIIEDIVQCYKIKRPVLVGTTNIEVSELISRRLKEKGIPHNVLNAKYHELEAEIIAKAGKVGAVTVATNMAGRGTDIVVDEEAKKLGGLKVIGTERHEARRIDNQLRGRTGRQGDPGESVFYLSLEDDLMKLFGAQNYINMFQSLQVEKGTPIKHPLITKAIEKAQKSIESNNYAIRKYVMEYDNILNIQRNIIYKDRDRLFEEDIIEVALRIAKAETDKIISRYLSGREEGEDIDEKFVVAEIKKLTGIEIDYKVIKQLSADEIFNEVKYRFYNKIAPYNKESIRKYFREIALNIVDTAWSDYINSISELQKEVQLQVYGHKDPLIEFQLQSSELFNNLVYEIQMRLLKNIFFAKLENVLEDEQ